MGIFVGCVEQNTNNAQRPSVPVQQEATIDLPPEANDFSFIDLGKTTLEEVLKKVPYERDAIIATNQKYMHVDYHLPDGSKVYVFYDYHTGIIAEVSFKLTDGTSVKLSDTEGHE